MDPQFLQLLETGRLTSENIQFVYNTVSEYVPAKDPAGTLANRCATAALCFAAQLPLDANDSILRRDLYLFLHEKTSLPLKETDVLCTLLCSILAVGFPIFSGPADTIEAQKPEAQFFLNPACKQQVEMYRVLLQLSN